MLNKVIKKDTNTSFRFRKADNNDRNKIYKLVETVLTDYGLKMNPAETDKDLQDLEDSYFNSNGWFEVIEDLQNRIIGSYGIFKINDEVCELRKMYLYPEFQGFGLGKKMMEKAIIKAKELRYKEIILETNKLLTRAIELYKKYGFVEYHPEHLSGRCDLSMRLIF